MNVAQDTARAMRLHAPKLDALSRALDDVFMCADWVNHPPEKAHGSPERLQAQLMEAIRRLQIAAIG